MKVLGYILFSFFYYLFYLCPIKPKKVFCVMTHDSSDSSNVGVVIKNLRDLHEGYQFVCIKKSDTKNVKSRGKILSSFSFFITKPYHLATSAFVIQDNIFLPLAYIRFKKSVRVIQLWHGTGTIKKFGQSVNEGKLGRLEHNANRTITHLVVNSKATKETYKEAFGVSEDKIYVYGLPRTDALFQKDKLEKSVEEFYMSYPICKGKKLILYVPTFRDDEVNNPSIKLDVNRILDELGEGVVLLLKIHPFVAEVFHMNQQKDETNERVLNLSLFKDINTLLMAADVLVTDYSSVIFDYCLLEKPMTFYAYDLDKFSESGRGFYQNYDDYVPGEIAYSMEELVQILNKDEYNLDKVREFKQDNYEFFDGLSTKRLIENVFYPQ